MVVNPIEARHLGPVDIQMRMARVRHSVRAGQLRREFEILRRKRNVPPVHTVLFDRHGQRRRGVRHDFAHGMCHAFFHLHGHHRHGPLFRLGHIAKRGCDEHANKQGADAEINQIRQAEREITHRLAPLQF